MPWFELDVYGSDNMLVEVTTEKGTNESNKENTYEGMNPFYNNKALLKENTMGILYFLK